MGLSAAEGVDLGGSRSTGFRLYNHRPGGQDSGPRGTAMGSSYRLTVKKKRKKAYHKRVKQRLKAAVKALKAAKA